MPSVNIDMLQTVANGLGELKDKMVFVGGAITELYADDPAASDVRPTLDVDCVIILSSRLEHSKLEENLRAKKFTHDTSQGATICRWIYHEIKVDVMPVDINILGFSNRWYLQGVENKISKTLPDGTEISVFSPEYYLASKIDAHKNRGGKDLRQSHDFEDIIYILDNCTDILENIRNADKEIKEYLMEECHKLLEDDNLSEGIECALPPDSDSERTEMILDLLQNIAGI